MKVSTIYMIEAKFNNGCVNTLREDSLVDLWHKQVRYMSAKRLQIIPKRGIFTVRKDLKGHLSHACIAW
jgi:hypothetical protein